MIREIKKYDFTPIIVTTSIADSKLYAYDMLNCFRYIEKPYDIEQMKIIIEKAFQMPQCHMEDRCIHLRDKDTVQVFKAKEIVYIYYSDRKLTVRNTNGISCFYYKSIMGLKRQLGDGLFSQCNRNTLVNRNYILKLDVQKNRIVLKDNYGELTVGCIYKRQLIDDYTCSFT